MEMSEIYTYTDYVLTSCNRVIFLGNRFKSTNQNLWTYRIFESRLDYDKKDNDDADNKHVHLFLHND